MPQNIKYALYYRYEIFLKNEAKIKKKINYIIVTAY